MFKFIKNGAGTFAAHVLIDAIYGMVIVYGSAASAMQWVREHQH